MLFLGELQIPTLAIVSLTTQEGWTYSVHEVIEGKPRRQFIAEGGPASSLSLYLHAEFIRPEAMVTELRRLAQERTICPLLTEAGENWGTYIIENVDRRRTWMVGGRVAAMSVDVSLADPGVEWSLPEPQPIAISGSASNVVQELPPEDTSGDIETITPQEIARR